MREMSLSRGRANWKLGRWLFIALAFIALLLAKDRDRAIRWYRKAAEQGYAKAQASLTDMYMNGKGVKRDYGLSAKWFRKAAYQDDVRGQNGLGILYDRGLGVPEDHKQAVYWFRKGAHEGDSDALISLGNMYADGRGGAFVGKQALKYLNKGLEKNMHSFAGYAARGALHEMIGDYRQALRDYNKALSIRPDNTKLLLSIASTCHNMRKEEQALSLWEHVLKKDPDNADVLNELEYGLVKKGRNLDRAEKMLRRARKLRPEDPYI